MLQTKEHSVDPAEKWQEMYDKGHEYFQKYGDLNLFLHRGQEAADRQLRDWLSVQRQLYAKNKLSEEKIQKLADIGMVWSVREEMWHQQYEKAAAFYRENGHLRIPRTSSLGRWINTQRRNKKRGTNAYFTPNKICLLEKIGMVWDASHDPKETWEKWYQKAYAFYSVNGHLFTEDKQLKTWLSQQRYAKKGRRGSLSREQIQKLENIGMVWDVEEFSWQRMYRYAKEYYEIHKILNIPAECVVGDNVRLGQWLARQRRGYRNYLNNRHKGCFITKEHIALLNDIGMIWDVTQIGCRCSFPEKAIRFYLRKECPTVRKMSRSETLGYELDVYLPDKQAAIEYDGIWHQNKQRMDEEKGRCCAENGIRLIRIREPGLPHVSECALVIELPDLKWESLALAIRQCFRYLNLPEPDCRLERDCGEILQSYRDYVSHSWDLVYFELREKHDKEGKLTIAPNAKSTSGINYRAWINHQRTAFRQGMLTELQQEKLISLGIQLQPLEAQWDAMYLLAEAYYLKNGDLNIKIDYETENGARLGAWISKQREAYRAHTLRADRVSKLARLQMDWNPMKTIDMQYKQILCSYYSEHGNICIPAGKYIHGLPVGEWLVRKRKEYREGHIRAEDAEFLNGLEMVWEVFEDRWERQFTAASEYFQRHGHLGISKSYKTEDLQNLGDWIAHQRALYKKGKLQADRKRRLDSIGMIWNPYDVRWYQNYEIAKKYYLEHGNLNIPVKQEIDGVKLGMWLSTQRQAKRGNPNYRFTKEREDLLNAIGMDWKA